MCGLFGAAGKLTYGDKEILRHLAILSTLRGEDSAGMVVVDDKGSASITKTVGTAFDLFDTTGFDKLSMYGKHAVIGHTRKATVGGISKRTAHPFNYDSIFGAHNGTLRNWRSLPGDTLDTDSMTLYSLISRVGLREAIEQTEGAYALTYWDATDNTLNILRNSERLLHYCFSDDFKKIFWASESWMLHVAINRSRDVSMANLAREGEPKEYTASVEPDTWWRVKIGGGKEALTFLRDHDETLKGGVVKPAYKAPFPTTGSYSRGYTGNSPWDWKGQQPTNAQSPKSENGVAATPPTNPSTSASQATTSTSQATQPQRPMLTLVTDSKKSGSETSKADELDDPVFDNEVVGFNGRPLDKASFDKTDCKCSFCQRDVDFDEARRDGIAMWLDAESFVCSTCTAPARASSC